MNTRTVLLWHNNGEQRITFTVNPEKIAVSRPSCHRVETLAMGGSVNVWGGRGLREVRLTTFLPGEKSPFFAGTEPLAALALLRSWQDSGDPVRLILSGSDINDAFLIEDVTEVLREGDEDVEITLTLREYKFKSALAALAGGTAAAASYGGAVTAGASGSASGAALRGAARPDERTAPETWTVKRGQTLWGIASTLYGDGTRWREIAEKNGISDPKKLPVGRVLTL